MTRTSTLAAIAALTLALAGCASGDDPAPSASGTIPGPTPAASPPTVTPAASPAVTSPPVTPGHWYTFGDEWALSSEADARGSGCTPGVGNLPDGAWFGFANAWTPTQISFDMACWWSGARAHQEGLDDGFEDAYDFYITNDNTTVRLVTIAANAEAKKANPSDGTFTVAQVIADPGGTLPTAAPYPVWIYVNGGVVTAIAVQYVP